MPGCSQDEEDETEYDNMDQVQKAMEMHLESHMLGNAVPVQAPPITAPVQNQSRILKSNPPKLEIGISSQEWEYFLGDWSGTWATVAWWNKLTWYIIYGGV